MEIKNRKLNKEELDLWKLITKDDTKIGSYIKNLEDTKINNKKKIESYSKTKSTGKKNKVKKVLEESIQINKRMKVKLERGLIKPEARLDLHGKTLIQARAVLIDFVISSIKQDIRCILIITGKKKTKHGSRGIIRENLPRWLKEKELVNSILYHCYATNKDGEDGARYVLLRKKEKVFYD